MVINPHIANRKILNHSFLELTGTCVSAHTPLIDVGLDSIVAVEFANLVSERLGTEISPVELFDHPTLDSILEFLNFQELSSGLGLGDTDPSFTGRS